MKKNIYTEYKISYTCIALAQCRSELSTAAAIGDGIHHNVQNHCPLAAIL